MSESEYTKSALPVHKYEDQITIYNWYEDNNSSNSLVLAKQVKIKFFFLFYLI